MKSVLQTIGVVVLAFYLLGWVGLVDFTLCVGKPGTCSAPQAAKARPAV